jgi:hypothetical protein
MDIEDAQHVRDHNMASHLFRLPLELRNMIYEFIWNAENDFHFQHRGTMIAATTSSITASIPQDPDDMQNSTICRTLYGLPKWLLASQDVLHQAITIFHRTRTFKPITDIGFGTQVGYYPYEKPPCKNPLLFNSSIRKVSLNYHNILVSDWESPPTLYWKPEHEENRFMLDLEETGAKNLQLFFNGNLMFVGKSSRDTYKATYSRPFVVFGERCKEVMLNLKCWKVRRTGCEIYRGPSLDYAINATRDCARRMVGSGFQIVEEETAARSDAYKVVLTARYKKNIDQSKQEHDENPTRVSAESPCMKKRR